MPITCPDTGNVLGIYNSASEVTRQRLTDRRAAALRRIGATPDLRAQTVWNHIMHGVMDLERDLPFVLLYRNEESVIGRPILMLEGALGVSRSHVVAPEVIDLMDDSNLGFSPAMRQAKLSGLPVIVKSQYDPMPEFLSRDMQWRGFEEPSHTVVIMPLTTSERLHGFLVLGMNPRREYDEDSQQFVQELGALSAALVSSSIDFQEARQREEKLFSQLSETEKFIRRVADVVPVGLFSISASGYTTWANQKCE